MSAGQIEVSYKEKSTGGRDQMWLIDGDPDNEKC